MTAMTQSGRRRLAPIERLLDSLADAARRERTVVAVLLGYVALWTATTLWFLRSFESRRVLDAALAGLFAAAAMYGKYWSIVLLLGLGVAALSDRRRAVYFSSAVPWVTIAVGTLALAPHLAWLI